MEIIKGMKQPSKRFSVSTTTTVLNSITVIYILNVLYHVFQNLSCRVQMWSRVSHNVVYGQMINRGIVLNFSAHISSFYSRSTVLIRIINLIVNLGIYEFAQHKSLLSLTLKLVPMFCESSDLYKLAFVIDSNIPILFQHHCLQLLI